VLRATGSSSAALHHPLRLRSAALLCNPQTLMRAAGGAGLGTRASGDSGEGGMSWSGGGEACGAAAGDGPGGGGEVNSGWHGSVPAPAAPILCVSGL
jgi:hypothetical protein